MRRGMLFYPQHDQQLRPPTAKEQRSSDLGMTCQAEGDHPLWIVDARLTMMDGHGPFTAFQRSTFRNAAAVAVPFQNLLPMTAEVFLVLPLQGVAGRADAKGEDLIPAARTADRTLKQTPH